MNWKKIAEIAKVNLARRHLLDFILQTHFNFKAGWFHKVLCDELEQFYKNVMEGKDPHLMIWAPPRHGKTEIITRRFAAWLFGKDPHLQIISCSYSADLSARNNRDAQRIIEDDVYRKIFPKTKLKSGKKDEESAVKNTEIFEIVHHRGAYRAAGVDGGITGMGFHIGIIDDPYKNAEEANSETIRSKILEWYKTTFYTRKEPQSGVIVIMTRWHPDDLCSRLLEEEPEKWKVLKFEAIAEKDSVYRKAGEALDSLRYPLDKLQSILKTLGSRLFEALFQQHPIETGGNIIKGAWFKTYTVLPELDYRFITADTAQKTKEKDDFSVFVCWGVSGGKLYLLDMIRGKWEAPDLKKRAVAFWNKHKTYSVSVGVLRKMYVEDKSSGTGLIQEIKLDADIPIEAIQRGKDKYTRCLDVLGTIEAGYVYLPAEEVFISDFLTECEAFTADDSHKHDDIVDNLFDAIDKGLPKKEVDWNAVAEAMQ